jgi:signal transduction histidine kinase/CheY-like chemotaxis protein
MVSAATPPPRIEAGHVATLTVLEYVNNALFVSLAGVCLLRWLRERGRPAAWLAATFGTLAGLVVASLALEVAVEGQPPAWVTKLILAPIILFPYLLFRFSASLERAARRTEVVAGVLAGTTVAWTLALPSLPDASQARPGWLTAFLAVFVVQWTVISLIVAVKLWRAGRGQPTAARQRMRGLSLAATGLSVVIVLAGVAPSSPEEPGPVAVASQLLTLASTLLFYLALAPPALLRNAWRHREQETLRQAMAELKAANRAEEVAAVMLPHVMRMVGGLGAALVDESGSRIGVHGDTPDPERPDTERPGLVRQPLSVGELLVWASPYVPVFGRQELELLQALGGLTELALERVRTAARDSELAAVVGASGDAIVSTALDGVVRSWNPAAEATYGRPAAEAVGRPLSMVVPADRSEELEELLRRMSHELRTPLNAILGFAQLLELDELRDDQRESLGHILSAARHLLALINEVLDIAAIEAGRLPLSVEPVALADVVGEAVSLIRPLADQHNVLLVGDSTTICDQHVLADRQRLKQILLNLLSNAVKYNREGGSVRLYCEPAPGERFRIKVADNGPGIAPEALERLFVPFERLTAEFSGVEGTGLGLPLSQRLAHAMGGTLELTTAIDQGSTFWVELPVAERPELPADEPETEDAADEAPEHPATRITVLYIEDNLSNLQLVDRVVSRRVVSRRPGVTLISAMRPMLGLDLAREHDPDLVLLDLHLPDMPGEEVLRRLRGDPKTAEIPVVILSADARPSLIKRLLGSGARAFLTKPLDVAELLALLDQVAEEREAQRSPA